jgi:glycogen operon protein
MLLHGDELGRTQQGNNNTYAQDSEISWVHWDQVDGPLVEFTAAVSRLRAMHPTFRRKRFFTGSTVRTGDGERLNDIVWLHPDGHPMQDGDWTAEGAKAIGMYLNGHGIAGLDATGHVIEDDHFLLYFNAGADDVEVTLPPDEYCQSWDVVIDTAAAVVEEKPRDAGTTLMLDGRSLLILREHTVPENEPDHSVAASLVAMADPRTPLTGRGHR